MSTRTPATHRYDDRRSPLVIHELSILRAPGISPGFTLRDLSPDITIVFGPNASGKSTTARAIQSILWPHPTTLRGHHLAARFSLDDDEWSIEASAGKVHRTRNGEPTQPPLIASLDDRGRYSLGLPELLASENQPLAQAILNESSGGFDLPQVAESLGYSEVIPPRLEAAHDVRNAAEALQQVIAAETSRNQALASRGSLLAQRDRAADAERQIIALDQALEYRRRLSDEAEAAAEVERFPENVHALKGDEPAELAGYTHQIGEVSAHIADTMRQRDHWQHILAETGLERVTNPRDQLTALTRIAEQQSEIAPLLATAERDIAAAEAERAAHQKRLAADLNDEQLAAVDADGMREFSDIARSYENIRARRTAREEVELWLGGVTPPENLDALRQGVETLQLRLQHPNAAEQREITGKARWIGMGAGFLLAGAGALLALWNDPLWWILAAVGVLLMILAWMVTTSASPKIAAQLERDYAQLPLPQPELWRVSQVRDLLGQLRDELKVALVEQEKADRWQDLEQERKELDQAYAETDARRQTAIKKYGMAPDLKEESLRLLAENLGRWQAADAALRGMEGRRNRLLADQTRLKARAGTILTGLGYNDPNLDAHLDDLRRRIHTHEDAVSKRDALQRRIEDELQPQLESITAQRDGLYKRYGLEPNDSSGMQHLQHQRALLETAKTRLAQRAADVRQQWEALSLTPHLREMDVDDLHAARDAASQLAGQRAEIEARLQQLDNAERTAMHLQDREMAQAELDQARLRLRDERDRISQQVVGNLLLSTVQQETRDAALPIVFHRARELFAIITRGKYELQFEQGPPPEFTALDTSTGMTLSLDQLSSGTRVQLLMAIRLAFVENVEVGPKLPVILDETLGNSDEFRASAIIDAAIDICRHGRQVFYFTAQGEEVARWLQRVESMPAEERPQVKVIELAEVRRDAGFDRLPIPAIVDGGQSSVPSPTEYDPETWAAALRVPAINPWAMDTGSTHLWYLLPHRDALHALLQNDISTLGQLTSFERTNPAQLELLHPDLPGLMSEVQLRADLLANVVQMWRIGRARPMQPGVLGDADMIDDAALDELQHMQADANNDGQVLIERLQTMDDPPLAEKPLDALELWMISEGYIAQGNRMSEADIRSRLIELASPAIREGSLDSRDVDRLMSQARSW